MSAGVDSRIPSWKQRPQLGDFLIWGPSKKRVRLSECPICALDPTRSRYGFDDGDARDQHFLIDHGPDDIGRPMAELLPETGDQR